ncbi:MAG: hypothetical protein IT317_16480 [Anaerolineales bacterium]|nr:hypothetical protein [Anaerolineales bacterium]
MTTNAPPPESELAAEFRRLGENLQQAATSAWQSEEAQRFRQELQTGLKALEGGLREAAAGPTGQRIKAEAEDFAARVRAGQVENRLRSDLLTALRAVNAALTKNAAPPPETPPTDNASGML